MSPFNTRGTRRKPQVSFDSTGPLIALLGGMISFAVAAAHGILGYVCEL